MREGPFREDENELPYLVYERRDRNYSNDWDDYSYDEYRAPKRNVRNDLHINNVPLWEFPTYVRRLNISENHKDSILRLVDIRARNCTFSINHVLDDLRMSFRAENEYVTTEIRVHYNFGESRFDYCGGTTYHDRLESMQWFKNLVRKMENEKGFSYEFCFNGHDFTSRGGRVVINDSFETMVMFEKDRYDDHYAYKIDFEKRRLEEYKVYSFIEYYEFFG
ncbi:MAG: hypothetical protein U0L42_06615 [Methanobrevibacter sp.]|uniref:hypothetical protein n=1 Tax=Methanobrevibacter sp. TaxID=66852 RepID=UPI002E7AA862|nr:hypothetical protein [Methanobrevibacter sp.]MEE0935330.1 hypothetical protein [Methanobrevibacter sp.]